MPQVIALVATGAVLIPTTGREDTVHYTRHGRLDHPLTAVAIQRVCPEQVMAYSCAIDHLRRVVYVRMSGPLTLTEIQQVTESLTANPEVQSGFGELIDLREATTDAISSDDVRRIAAATLDAAERRAFVTTDMLTYGLARMFEIYRALKKRFNVYYDEKGAIGRRYRRQDEAGTPFCITVDGDTLTAGSVTVRERDSCEQTRVGVAELGDVLSERLGV